MRRVNFKFKFECLPANYILFWEMSDLLNPATQLPSPTKTVEDFDHSNPLKRFRNQNCEDSSTNDQTICKRLVQCKNGEISLKTIRKCSQNQAAKEVIRCEKLEDDTPSISSTPIKDKYSHLIPDHIKAEYTLEQRYLLVAQEKLDQHLFFLKINRNRKKGEFFRSIKKNLSQAFNIFIQMTHIKQMLTIDPHLYLYLRDKDRGHWSDVLICLPPNSNLIKRRDLFKQNMYRYLIEHNVYGPEKEIFVIPSYKFHFDQKKQVQLKLFQKPTKQHPIIVQKSSINPFDILNPKGQSFKAKIYKLIQDKSQKIKKQFDQSLLYGNKRQFSQKQLKSILDQIQIFYSQRNVSSIFFTTLIENLNKKVSHQIPVINQLVLKLIQLCPTYIKKIQHQKNAFVQVDKRNYNYALKMIENRGEDRKE